MKRVPMAENKSRGMNAFVVGLLGPYMTTLAIVLAAMLIETAMNLASPWPLKVILDNVVGHHKLPVGVENTFGPAPGHGNPAALAAVAATAFVAIAVVAAAASYVANYYTESVAQWVANDLRLRVFAHLEQLSLSYYDTHQTSTMLSTLTDDVLTIQEFASASTLGMFVDILTIGGMVGIMLWLNWDFALIAFSVTPFLLLFVMRFKRAVKAATHEVRRRQSDILGVLQEGLESMRAVKAYGRQDLEEERLAAASRRSVDAALSARKIKALLSPITSVVVALCTAFVLWRGANLILTGAMTVGALTVFLAYLTKFFKPVQDLAKMTNTIAQTAVSVDRIRSLLEVDTVIPESVSPKVPESVRGAIRFEDVAFSYDSETPVLKDVSFSIEPGQVVGIVGATGGGKSTILNLITRFYDASSGRVLVDGIDVREFALAALRSQIGVVLQESVLFPGTIRDNIGFGRAGATESEIVAAAKIANADDFISHLANGYDTLVGERGSTLSGGQRQRIGIARAIVRNAPILLLDEPTAALDAEAERLVIEATERLMKGRTVVTIAHRLSTIRDADNIIVLKDGVVCEQGTHAELLALDGVYASLYRVQFESSDSSAPAALSVGTG
jgi:ABC-type multidrug transport system fused ATPase/permease subunit